MRELTVATRGAELAIAQTGYVISEIKKNYPDVKIAVKKITTQGDRDRKTALWELKTSGFFTSQIEDALCSGKADLAVHSFKDLPTQQREGLAITAVLDRRYAEDCLVSAQPVDSIEQLPASARIGTSSLRRAVQIKRLRADVKVLPIRGNVPTRVRQMDEGKFDAVILARAGLERLGLEGRIAFCFEAKKFIPAPAQGMLAIETRRDDKETNDIVASIDSGKARIIAMAERQILATTKCGCHAPVGAYAEIIGDRIEVIAFVSDLQGENFIMRKISGRVEDALMLAEKIAYEMLDAGGREILEVLEK